MCDRHRGVLRVWGYRRSAILWGAAFLFGLALFCVPVAASDEPPCPESPCEEFDAAIEFSMQMLLLVDYVTVTNNKSGVEAEWFKVGNSAGFLLRCIGPGDPHQDQLSFTSTAGLSNITISPGRPWETAKGLTGTCSATGTHVIAGECALHGSDDYTYHIADLASLSVNGAQQGQTAGVYWAEKEASGNVTVTAVLDPQAFGDGTGLEMPVGMLTWTGGTAVQGQPWQRTVSKTEATGAVVTAQVTAQKSVTILIMDLAINAPAQTAYVGLGSTLQIQCTAAPSGGTFKWTKASGPGNVTFGPNDTSEAPTFSADEAGNYTVKVAYTLNGCTVEETSVTITVWEVASVVWETYSDNVALDTCPNNGGKRVYSDAKGPNDGAPSKRQKVSIKATVTPAVEGVSVLFKSWDVDDPSTDDQPVDPNGAVGGDNRAGGAGTLSAGSASTDSSGEATVLLTVSLRPGDNYRVAASSAQSLLNAMTQAQADAGNPPTHVKLSEMLTVWRKLYVDSDRMQADVNHMNRLTGEIDGATYQAPNTDLEVDDVPSDFEADDQFNGGFIKIYYATPQVLAVLDFDANLNDDNVIVGGNHTAANDKDYELYDDDCTDSLVFKITFPDRADTSLLAQAFAPAYVAVIVVEDTQDANIAFDRNVEENELAALFATDFEYFGKVSTYFCAAHLICSFQGPSAMDRDPDSETPIALGVSLEDSHGATVFREVLRDDGCAAIEAAVVVHELGHCTGAEHEDDGVMDNPWMLNAFSPTSLHKIRSKTWAGN